MKRRNILAANWKMNPDSLEKSKEIFDGIRKFSKKIKNTDIVVCPPFPFIFPLSKLNFPKNVFLGSQNVSEEYKGAFTGEVSAEMLKNIGTKYVIIGHSERVAMGENSEMIRKKLNSAFNSGLIPILCVGEKERDRDGNYLSVIKTQIKEYLSGLQKKDLVGIIIAYEPVWSIGKSYKEAMSATDVHEMTLVIKKIISEFLGKDIAAGAKILYGGSVEPENAISMVQNGNIDGFLVGHDSLLPNELEKIAKTLDLRK